MKVQTATFEHKHGTDSFVALTAIQLQKQIADYCREWWGEQMGDIEMPQSDGEVITLYFIRNTFKETVEYGESFIEEELSPTPFKQLTAEEAQEKTEMIYIEMESGFHIALDHTYMDQVEDFKLKLPTGEVIDTKLLK